MGRILGGAPGDWRTNAYRNTSGREKSRRRIRLVLANVVQLFTSLKLEAEYGLLACMRFPRLCDEELGVVE
jgi:hypothetical protein